MTNFASGKIAWSISERSGLRYPYNEMMYEPGTNLWIHISENDGEYNLVDHPQGRVKAPKADKINLQDIYGEYRDGQEPSYITDGNGNPLVYTGQFGIQTNLIY